MDHVHYVTGGPLLSNSPVYIQREADVKAANHLQQLDYITIVEPRQYGKTSFLNRLKSSFVTQGYVFAFRDLMAAKASAALPASWYTSLGDWLLKQMPFISGDGRPELPHDGASWEEFLAKVAESAQSLGLRVVIVLDEIGDMPSDWSTEFFSIIRSVYTSRDNLAFWQYLTFITAGSFNPKKLIKDKAVSNFNVASQIYLDDFTFEQILTLAGHLGLSPDLTEVVAARIEYWTGGQPYLCQFLCDQLTVHRGGLSISGLETAVDDAVEYFFLHDTHHLSRVKDITGQPDLLAYVQQITTTPTKFSPAVNDRHFDLAHIEGIIKADSKGWCQIRNRICERALTEILTSKTPFGPVISEVPSPVYPSIDVVPPLSGGKMNLSGVQVQKLSEALRKAYSLARFDQMLRFRLDKSREDLALGDDYEEIVYKVISRAQSENWIPRLVLAAFESNPGNAELLMFAQEVGLAPGGIPTRTTLERMINETNSLIDVVSFLERLGRIVTQVCRIEIKGRPYGTGFLVGPDIIMTNYHVVESVIRSTKGHKPEDIVLRFDYKLLADGTTLNSGVVYLLSLPEWLIDSSPYDPVDMEKAPKSGSPQLENLDYALLRVEGEPGNDQIGQTHSVHDQPRGWITLPVKEHDFTPQSALFIVQHPLSEPIKLALNTQAIIELNANRTRVTYQTNTDLGSSGSPCFNQDWELVALHHGGDPDLTPMWNEGIPFKAIWDLLEKRGLRGIFDH